MPLSLHGLIISHFLFDIVRSIIIIVRVRVGPLKIGFTHEVTGTEMHTTRWNACRTGRRCKIEVSRLDGVTKGRALATGIQWVHVVAV